MLPSEKATDDFLKKWNIVYVNPVPNYGHLDVVLVSTSLRTVVRCIHYIPMTKQGSAKWYLSHKAGGFFRDNAQETI